MLALVVAAAALQYPLGLAAAAQLLELSTGLGPPRRSAVRAAYRRKAAISHPDVSTAPNAQRYFLHITAAYETLLQYSVADTTQSSMKSPSTVSVSTSPSSAAAAEPDKAVAHSAPLWSAQAGSCRPERFEKQVAAWRLYWLASFQTLQCSAEAERKALQVSALAHEREKCSEQISRRFPPKAETGRLWMACAPSMLKLAPSMRMRSAISLRCALECACWKRKPLACR